VCAVAVVDHEHRLVPGPPHRNVVSFRRGTEIGLLAPAAQRIIPAPTVAFVPSSIRMKLPVVRLTR
jgi:hypothetical protein